jgi:hypothetical protein
VVRHLRNSSGFRHLNAHVLSTSTRLMGIRHAESSSGLRRVSTYRGLLENRLPRNSCDFNTYDTYKTRCQSTSTRLGVTSRPRLTRDLRRFQILLISTRETSIDFNFAARP